MGWVKIDGTATEECSIANTMMRDGERLMGLGRNGDSQACGMIFDNSVEQYRFGAVSPGWHHLAFTLGGGTLTFYVDGVSTASDAEWPGGVHQWHRALAVLRRRRSHGASPDL